MANSAVIHFLFVVGVFEKGLTALIQTQQTVVAAVGDEACLTCQLTQSKDVLQVTWQKILPEGEKNLATNNKFFGQRVNAGFQGKLKFKDVGLQNCSIVIREVTENDKGCYLCLFNTYPDGALTGRTCLQLYELHEPILHVRESDSAEESVVSCSATGRPAPTVTLTVTQPHLSDHNTGRVNNTNGTVTVTTTAELARSRDNSAQVGCAVRVLSVQKEVFLMIPELKQTSADDDLTLIIAVVVVVACSCCVFAVVAFLFIRKHKNSLPQKDSERNKTPQRTIRDTHETKTPLMKQDNEIRQRTSTKKSPTSPSVRPLTSAVKKLFT
ncbi:OX-2 membrane glycoprotein isoform X1 [Lates calcarifer]|uniref:OX-2 membrane glycoprotein isoform X1 n=1 Tax=Lates calcarifer TaxID=8187 RepID=A0A4W6F5T9_LATCA|nr:OX-2 membrane glycoprotein isoform X1 [Lates calcarifer]